MIHLLKVVILAIVIIAACVALLSIRVLLKKNGRFPNTHVSGSRAMRERGVSCAQSQDFAARHKRAGAQEFSTSSKNKKSNNSL